MNGTAAPLYVLTGGPGAGKTTLLATLARRGFVTVPEAGRAVIRAQQAAGGTALPWADRRAFAAAMLAHDLRAHRRHRQARQPVFFDRGLPDVLGYARLEALPETATMRWAARWRRYRPTVLWLPFWPDIYHQDPERRQDASTARATATMMARVYRELGYRIHTVPPAEPQRRAEQVLALIGHRAPL